MTLRVPWRPESQPNVRTPNSCPWISSCPTQDTPSERGAGQEYLLNLPSTGAVSPVRAELAKTALSGSAVINISCSGCVCFPLQDLGSGGPLQILKDSECVRNNWVYGGKGAQAAFEQEEKLTPSLPQAPTRPFTVASPTIWIRCPRG